MSLRVDKLAFSADWVPVRRRCVTNPECCEEITQIPLPCGTGCDYTLPSLMYLTFAGQTRIPDGSYPVRFVPLANADTNYDLASLVGTLGPDFSLSPNMIWAGGTVDLSGGTFLRSDAGGTPSGLPGPKRAQQITDDAFGNPRFLSLYVWPHCEPGGGMTLQIAGLIVSVVSNTVSGITFDGLIDGYYPPAPFASINNAIMTTEVRGIDCTPLLPWLDQPLVVGTLDITE